MATVYIAADHAGFALKEALKPFIEALGHVVEDCGAASLDPADDYPDVVLPCAHKVAQTPGSFGVVIGGSGQGEAMAANRVPSVRAAVYYGGAYDGLIEVARSHNDANVLSLGARFVTEDEAKKAVATFLATPFSLEERHVRRINKF